MKIQVVRIDGGIETINLVGTVIACEPGQELPFPRNQSPLKVKATGMDYFFREDGRYDGWGMAVNIPAADDNDPMKDARALIEAVEADREFPEEPQ